MNTQIKNAAIGAVGGYVAGLAIGHFLKPQYTQHIGLIAATLGAIIGYNVKSTAASMAASATPAASAQ